MIDGDGDKAGTARQGTPPPRGKPHQGDGIWSARYSQDERRR
jgi:hypothetical protein